MRRGTFAKLGALVAVVALLAAACQRGEDDPDATEEEQPAQQAEGGLLQEIRDRGTLQCGVNNTVPGFGFETGGGEIEGFDIDFCTAIAAAVFNTPEVDEMIELTPIDAEERFNALRAGEYDVLVRNTTWTSSRDGSEGVAFAHVNFYDGQAMMARAGEFSEVADMDGANICVTAGTTTELNLADYFQQLGIDFTPVTFAENPQLQEAFIAGQCDGWTSDRSQLAGIRSAWPEGEGGPESLEILDDIMSKEPLAPGVLDSEIELGDALNWVVHGLIYAEELGVNSNNVDAQASNPDNPSIAALLGVAFQEGEPLDSGLALGPTFMQDVLKAVGNYGEIFDRHLGPDTALGLERGINALWTDGGIQYASPIR
jgi:general L-amino acid transport system substrate-binding protein